MIDPKYKPASAILGILFYRMVIKSLDRRMSLNLTVREEDCRTYICMFMIASYKVILLLCN